MAQKELVQIDKEELEKLQLKAKAYEFLADTIFGDTCIEYEDDGEYTDVYLCYGSNSRVRLDKEAQNVLGELGWLDDDDPIHDIGNYWKPNAR